MIYLSHPTLSHSLTRSDIGYIHIFIRAHISMNVENGIPPMRWEWAAESIRMQKRIGKSHWHWYWYPFLFFFAIKIVTTHHYSFIYYVTWNTSATHYDRLQRSHKHFSRLLFGTDFPFSFCVHCLPREEKNRLILHAIFLLLSAKLVVWVEMRFVCWFVSP